MLSGMESKLGLLKWFVYKVLIRAAPVLIWISHVTSGPFLTIIAPIMLYSYYRRKRLAIRMYTYAVTRLKWVVRLLGFVDSAYALIISVALNLKRVRALFVVKIPLFKNSCLGNCVWPFY
jgi:hypothetical protein